MCPACIPLPSLPEPQPLEPLIKQINDIIYKIAPELKIRQQVQMRIEIMQVITAHEQEAIKQFTEKCIEGMPKLYESFGQNIPRKLRSDTYYGLIEGMRLQYEKIDAHLRAMAKEAK